MKLDIRMQTGIRVKLLVAVGFFFILFSKPLESKVSCVGVICTQIPASIVQEIYQLDTQFQYQYMDTLSKSMAIAGANSNLTSGMIGLGSINRFQIGAGVGGSLLQERNTSITYGSTHIDKLPNMGVGVSPSFAGGINLGWAMGLGGAHYEYVDYDDDADENEEDEEEVSSVAPTLLHRINIYVNGASAHATVQDFKSALPKKAQIDGDMHFSQWGFMIRFLVFAPGEESYWFRFMGLSVGTGMMKSLSTINLVTTKMNNAQFQAGPYRGRWTGDVQMNYDLNVKTIPIDIRSGFRLMNFLTLFGGLGYAKHSADVVLDVSRKGPITLTADATSSLFASKLDSSIYKLLGAAAAQQGFLEVESRAYQKLVYGQGYGIVGLEINVSFFQIFSEFYFTGYRGSTGNIGIKLNF